MTIYILTDSTATFPATSIGQKNLRVIPAHSEKGCPALEDYLHAFDSINHDTLVITPSSAILPAYDIAVRAANLHGGTTRITILDSRQVGAGMGILALISAQTASSSLNLADVETRARIAIANIYTLFATESHTQDEDSADGITISSMEDGQLALYKKVRTRRHLLETFQEFLDEFEHPHSIAFSQGVEGGLRSRALRELSSSLFPGAPFSEQELSPVLSARYGNNAASLTVYEPER
jgi:fatty acid-binding protein DegV